MLKLMKYEFKKQMFSKIIIAAILGVLTLYFGIACVIDKETQDRKPMRQSQPC